MGCAPTSPYLDDLRELDFTRRGPAGVYCASPLSFDVFGVYVCPAAVHRSDRVRDCRIDFVCTGRQTPDSFRPAHIAPGS